jgi:translation elongation factor EF-G
MNNTPVEKVCNFAIAGHASSGKTSLADLMLFKSKAVNRLGSGDQKNSISDYRQEERDKGGSAFREAMQSATPILLEPIMDVHVHVPDEYMGDIHGEPNHRHGRILGMEVEEGMQVVHAEVPIAEMFSYATQLRSLTHERGSFDIEFARYEHVPGNIAKDIQAKATHKHDDD